MVLLMAIEFIVYKKIFPSLFHIEERGLIIKQWRLFKNMILQQDDEDKAHHQHQQSLAFPSLLDQGKREEQ